MAGAAELGVAFHDPEGDAATAIRVDLARVNARVKALAADQSADIAAGSRRTACGSSEAVAASTVPTEWSPTTTTTYPRRRGADRDRRRAAHAADARSPTASGSSPGSRSTTSPRCPTELIVVGSGVTGAEFASAYLALGIPVTLVSSRDRVLPGEDADAAKVLEEVLTRRGMNVLAKSRMESVARDGDVVTVTLTDGRTVQGSHCILALGSVPNTADLGLEEAGVVAQRRRLRQRRPGLAHVGPRRLRRRRLHRRPDAGLGRGDAGPDRDVALPRRRGEARST